MSLAFQSSQPIKQTRFVDEELTCPLCESYEVAEQHLSYQCTTCGVEWKILALGA